MICNSSLFCFMKCSHQQELSGMIERVDEWWSVCEEVCHWLSDTEKKLVTHKPLASSTDLIEQQKNSLQVHTCETILYKTIHDV